MPAGSTIPMQGRCASKLARSDPPRYCQAYPLKGKKRCRMHGGGSPGAKKGNEYAVRHGIYRANFTTEELEVIESGHYEDALGKVDDQLLKLRIESDRISAVLKATMADEEVGFELSERKTAQVQGGGGAASRVQVETVRKKPDLRAQLDRTVSRIAQLEMVRANLKIAEIEDMRAEVQGMLDEMAELDEED